jgi:hypothetical protein
MSTNWNNETYLLYQDLKTEGFAVTIRVQGSVGTFNPDTLTYTGGSEPTDYTTYGIFKEYDVREVRDLMIQRGDKKLIISSYGLPDLTPNNQVLVNDVVQNVIFVKQFAPANVVIGYELQVRA